MSLLSQLEAAIADGTIQKATKKPAQKQAKPTKPKGAPKYTRKGEKKIPGERHGFREMKAAPPVKPPTTFHEDRKEEANGKLLLRLPDMAYSIATAHYLDEAMTKEQFAGLPQKQLKYIVRTEFADWRTKDVVKHIHNLAQAITHGLKPINS